MKLHKPNFTGAKTRIKNIGKACLSGGLTVLTVLTWETLEELLENLIALGISALVASFFLIVATQGIKLGIKKIIKVIFPVVKSYTYKEGEDKMNAIRNYWKKVWGNRITGSVAGVGFAGTAYFVLEPVIEPLYLLILAVIGVFVVAYNFAIFFGGETLNQIQERWAQEKLDKKQRDIIKKAQAKIKAIAKAESQSEAEKVKAEAKAKAKQEEEAEIEKAMAEILAKKAEKK